MATQEESEEFLQTYLKMVAGLATFTLEDIVLQHGKSYEAPVNPRPGTVHKGKDKECFRNAYELVQTNPKWKYVEGFALHTIPVHHAWTVRNDGHLIETTWKTSGVAYFGIELPMDFVNRVILETGVWGALNPLSQTFRNRFVK